MFEDSLATITDTVGNVNQQLYGNTTPSVTTELSDQQMRRRKVLRLVVFLVILGGITTLIIYKLKK
jgi:hypothetical protein